MSEICFIEARPRRMDTGAEVTVRLAGGGTDTPYRRGGQDYRAGIVEMPRFRAEFGFDDNGWTGGTVPTSGAVNFMPGAAGLVDELAGYYWREAPITIDAGDEGSTLSRRLTGTVANVASNEGQLAIALADPSKLLDKPLLGTGFAGTGGIEGPSEATGRPKRRSWGYVFNVEGELLDKANNIYEFGDPARPLYRFEAVRDKGRAGPMVLLPWQGSIAATFAALQASTPEAGGAVVAPSIACVKWWTEPAGPLTADIRGETAGGYAETPVGIAARLLSTTGGPEIIDLAAANALRPATCGIHIAAPTDTAAQALDRLLLGVSLYWVLQPDGLVRIGEWAWGAPVASLPAIFLGRDRQLPPVKARMVGYRRNHRTHSASEISAAVLLADDVTYRDGTPIEMLKPAEPGANVGIITRRGDEPLPDLIPIGSLYLDGTNETFRFEGNELAFEGAALEFGGVPLLGPGWVYAVPDALPSGGYAVEIVPPPAQQIFTNFAGVAQALQFPRTLTPIVKRGGVDMRTSNAALYSIDAVGVTATVNNITGSADKGRITVTAGGAGHILLTVVFDGRDYGPYKILFSTKQSPLPAVGGSGAKSGTDTSFPNVTSAIFAPVAGPITISVATGESIICAFPADYALVATGNANAALVGKWQWSPAGAGTWTDAPGSPITGSVASWFATDFSGEIGSGLFNQNITGLAAGDYDVRFVGALGSSLGSPVLEIFDSTATVVVQ